MAASFLGSTGKAQALPGGGGWSREQNAARWAGASCRSPGSTRGAIALLYAEVPTHAQTHFPPWTISTRRESAKGARCALAQIHWVALLEERIHKLLNPR